MEQQREKLQEETKRDISPIIDQEVDPEAIHQFLNQIIYPILCQVHLGTTANNFE